MHIKHNTYEKREKKNRTPIEEKLINSGALISKADKGNSTIIIYQDEYHKKS